MTHGRPAWYDIEMRGRRLEAIFKDCNTKYWNAKEEDAKESYFRRMTIIEKTIQPYVDQMTGIKKYMKRLEKDNDTVTVST